MEGVGHRRDPLAGSGANVAPFLASLGGATSRERYEQPNGETR
jgi:hypothetical protein